MNAIVVIAIGGGYMVSTTISIKAVNELKLEVGKCAYAIIKASFVMIGVDD